MKRNHLKKVLAAVLTLAMAVSVLTIPARTAKADAPALSMQALVGDTITARFIADIDAATEAAYDSIVMRASIGSTDPVELTGTKDAEGKTIFDLKDIYSQRMAETISGKIVGISGSNETQLNQVEGVSIASYCDQLHAAEPDNAELTAFMARMLDFGAKCQQYVKWKTATLANTADWVQAAVATAGAPEGAVPQGQISSMIDSTAGRIKAVFLTIKNKVAISFKVTSNAPDALKVVVSSDSIDKTFDLSQAGTDPAISVEGSDRVVTLDEFSPKQFDEIVTARVYAGTVEDANLKQTVRYNINTYCVNKANDASIGAVCKAMYAYGTSAEAYAESAAFALPRQVLDFEALSGDLYAQGMVTNGNLSEFATYNSAQIEDAKGVNGSKALAYNFIQSAGEQYWAQYITLDLAAAGGQTNWKKAGMLWIWVDASAFTGTVGMDVKITDAAGEKKTVAGQMLYGYTGGAITELGAMADPWDGSGRLQIPGGFKGYVGLKTSYYSGLDLTTASKIYFYIQPSSFPVTLYLDDIWLTAENAAPPVTFAPEPVCIHVMDMEDAALDNPTDEMLAYPWGGSGTDVSITKVAGKGFDGTSAIEYKMLSSSEKLARIRMDKIDAYPTNLAGADIIWFWVDSTGISRALNLEVHLYSTAWKDYNLQIGKTFYLWNGGTPTEATTVDAWDHVKARTPLPQGYVGFVGIPFSAFYVNDADNAGNSFSVADVKGLTFDIPNPTAGEVLYFDEFWATDADTLPNVTFAPGPVGPKKIQVMDMESSALDGTPENEKVYSPWGNDTLVTLAKVADKGFDGSHAIQYTVLDNQWNSSMQMRMDKISDYTTNLSDTDTIWFWIDGSGVSKQITLEPRVYCSGYHHSLMMVGQPYYLWNGGLVTGGTSHVAYGSVDYGRITIAAGYKGFVGIPFASFYEKAGDAHDKENLDPAQILGFYLYFSNASAGDTLYVDELWATSDGSTPDVTYPAVAKKQIHVMDMESAELDGTPVYEKVHGEGGSSDNPLGDSTKLALAKVSGKGFDGSAAIQCDWLQDNQEKAVFFRMDKIAAYPTNLSGTDIFWFWIDASDITRDFKLEPQLYNSSWKLHRLQIGKPFYLYQASGVTSGSTVEAWGGQTYGRIQIPAGYVGFIGIPYTSFYENSGSSYDGPVYDTGNILGLYLKLPNPVAGDTIYVDELWATDAASLPDVTFN